MRTEVDHGKLVLYCVSALTLGAAIAVPVLADQPIMVAPCFASDDGFCSIGVICTCKEVDNCYDPSNGQYDLSFCDCNGVCLYAPPP